MNVLPVNSDSICAAENELTLARYLLELADTIELEEVSLGDEYLAGLVVLADEFGPVFPHNGRSFCYNWLAEHHPRPDDICENEDCYIPSFIDHGLDNHASVIERVIRFERLPIGLFEGLIIGPLAWFYSKSLFDASYSCPIYGITFESEHCLRSVTKRIKRRLSLLKKYIRVRSQPFALKTNRFRMGAYRFLLRILGLNLIHSSRQSLPSGGSVFSKHSVLMKRNGDRYEDQIRVETEADYGRRRRSWIRCSRAYSRITDDLRASFSCYINQRCTRTSKA